ncbi:C-type lectin domain family 4 member E-like [Neoarius graeffei]|uniref:C-type lectin domain family 4 member E-like n=1 Tax=Neoarius graeffei TaxID=443677 RepID=UPI00298C34F2|nr:C-type lectin domain family 4 member E-like [Neoarius graeffei]
MRHQLTSGDTLRKTEVVRRNMSVTMLSIKFNNLNTKNNQLQTNYTNLTTERDQLLWEKFGLYSVLRRLGWRVFGSRIYYISAERKNWTESRQDCTERGSDLVIINSREEQEFISKLLCCRNAQVGLNDRPRDGMWKWVDDTTLTTGYWGHGEPNSRGGNEDCILTGYRTNHFKNWADYPCDEFTGICEKTSFN